MFMDNKDSYMFTDFVEKYMSTDPTLWKEIVVMNISRWRSQQLSNQMKSSNEVKITGDANAVHNIMKLGH
jgi:hypothetical protein